MLKLAKFIVWLIRFTLFMTISSWSLSTSVSLCLLYSQCSWGESLISSINRIISSIFSISVTIWMIEERDWWKFNPFHIDFFSQWSYSLINFRVLIWFPFEWRISRYIPLFSFEISSVFMFELFNRVLIWILPEISATCTDSHCWEFLICNLSVAGFGYI